MRSPVCDLGECFRNCSECSGRLVNRHAVCIASSADFECHFDTILNVGGNDRNLLRIGYGNAMLACIVSGRCKGEVVAPAYVCECVWVLDYSPFEVGCH